MSLPSVEIVTKGEELHARKSDLLMINTELEDNTDRTDLDNLVEEEKDTISDLDDSKGEVDRYGFYVADSFHTSAKLKKSEVDFRKGKEGERVIKWVKMVKNWDKVTWFRKEKLKRRIRKGIPDTLRGLVWVRISESWRYVEKYPSIKAIDLSKLDELTIDEIERDINRTFPRHLQFESNERGNKGQGALRRLLQLYAATDTEVGYCQGMAFIAGLMLIYMSEEEAFYCFQSSLKLSKFNLRLMFLPNMVEAQKTLFVFGELGKKYLGKLWVHLEEEGIHHTMYATEWLLTMYCRGFSFDLVTRVWDVFFNEGYKIVYRVALALVKSIEKELLSNEFEDIMGIFRKIPELVDAERLMGIAFSIPLKSSEIEHLDKKFFVDFNAKQQEKKKESETNVHTFTPPETSPTYIPPEESSTFISPEESSTFISPEESSTYISPEKSPTFMSSVKSVSVDDSASPSPPSI
eukprot:CAMPEP_0119051398 /NCGR_PEP_ID=MMETSP1177-20130426/73027_1 /TAXON_ID=2985 /ORGANISM="Ochromonas sp, Strain CCMP1899" /LENGTH=463 /DNA_ID=CAMNT_0007030585 /DNA_START=128 /DNA_END=1519 /DNA_ORIENTATION=+